MEVDHSRASRYVLGYINRYKGAIPINPAIRQRVGVSTVIGDAAGIKRPLIVRHHSHNNRVTGLGWLRQRTFVVRSVALIVSSSDLPIWTTHMLNKRWRLRRGKNGRKRNDEQQ